MGPGFGSTVCVALVLVERARFRVLWFGSGRGGWSLDSPMSELGFARINSCEGIDPLLIQGIHSTPGLRYGSSVGTFFFFCHSGLRH